MIQANQNRRRFLKASASLGLFSIIPGHVRGVASSDKLNIAGIGIGGRGFSNLKAMASENIVALCDVDPGYASRCFNHFPKAKRWTDFRKMLEKQKDIDAVMIGTPDHTHAVISITAMQADKHVYCEKPLTHDIYEARQVAKVASEMKVCTQTGIQRHSDDGPRMICEWIWAGIIGDVHEVDAWCSLSYYPAGHASWSPKWLTRPAETPTLPNGLNWDLWIGPAPMRPYHSAYHPGSWRAWWDFGSGMMGDRGVHTLDSVMWALNLVHPESVESNSLGLNPETHPIASIVTFRFPERGKMPPLKLTWYDGLTPPRPPELEDGRRFGGDEGGILFKGTKGSIMCNYVGDGARIIPEKKMRELQPLLPAPSLPRIQAGHQQNWIRACKGLDTPSSDFDYGARLTEICILGNIARRANKLIRWDPENMRVSNLEEPNQWVRKTYREGWEM
ncbi:hypothetical protein BVY01_01075 [bacterium I07]|nr:hypothetical protein BVY01_01075 [bacterium I07]